MFHLGQRVFPTAWGLCRLRRFAVPIKLQFCCGFMLYVDFLAVLFEVSSVFTSPDTIRMFQDIGGYLTV
jgi:hypothetical protein